MMKTSLIVLILLIGTVAATSTPTELAANAICSIFVNIYDFLYGIAGGVGVLIITIQGIKWTASAEDASVRKAAKMGIIHAVIGLIIVVMAVWIVQIVYPYGYCDFTSI